LEVSGRLHALTDLPPEKNPRHPLNGRLGSPQGRSGWYGELHIVDLTGRKRLDTKIGRTLNEEKHFLKRKHAGMNVTKLISKNESLRFWIGYIWLRIGANSGTFVNMQSGLGPDTRQYIFLLV
jgi:hypothetical protein